MQLRSRRSRRSPRSGSQWSRRALLRSRRLQQEPSRRCYQRLFDQNRSLSRQLQGE